MVTKYDIIHEFLQEMAKSTGICLSVTWDELGRMSRREKWKVPVEDDEK